MRRKCVDPLAKRVLIADIANSTQSVDLTVPANCDGLGRIRHFRLATDPSWPPNCLPGWPAAAWLGSAVEGVTRAQVFQLAGCPLRCWYCFVPYQLLSGSTDRGRWVSADHLVELYSELPNKPTVLDLSGGAPEIAPEWPAWTIEALQKRGLEKETYLWSDDSLTTDLLLRPEMRPILTTLEDHRGYGRVCCIKGIDAQSYANTTRDSVEGFERQLSILEGYLRTDMDLYGYITLVGAPSQGARGSISALLDRLQSSSAKFPERIVPLRIGEFGTMSQRIGDVESSYLHNQDELVCYWNESMRERGLRTIEASDVQ